MEKTHIERSLRVLRPLFASGTPDLDILGLVLRNGSGELSPKTLEKFAKTHKHFTTAEVMQHFSCGKGKAAGSLAVLVKMSKIEPRGEKTNGFSRWVWTG